MIEISQKDVRAIASEILRITYEEFRKPETVEAYQKWLADLKKSASVGRAGASVG